MAFDFNILYRFWFLVILNTFSIICSLFVLYYLLFDRTLRKAMHNHIIIIILFIGIFLELTDIPFILHFVRVGTKWKISMNFSLFWSLIDYGCYTTQIILFAWATIERHILIFHDQWLSTRKKRFFLHYLPIIIIFTYCFIYYLVAVVILSCDHINYQNPTIGVPTPCIYNNVIFSSIDIICQQMIPTLIISFVSIALLIRILYQKSRLNRHISWRKQRKMTIQLLSITILYQLLNLPWAFLQFCSLMKAPIDVNGNAYKVACFLSYYLINLFPFISCGTLPELHKKVKKLLFWQRHPRTVRPTLTTINAT